MEKLSPLPPCPCFAALQLCSFAALQQSRGSLPQGALQLCSFAAKQGEGGQGKEINQKCNIFVISNKKVNL